MEFTELFNHLKLNTNIEYFADDLGCYFKDTKYDTKIFLPWENLPLVSLEDFDNVLTQGHDVEQITRVTGFFSKVSSWNAGKLAELKDRRRNYDLDFSEHNSGPSSE